jgi:hypothetical protein
MVSGTTKVHAQLISTHPLCNCATGNHPRTSGEICCIFMSISTGSTRNRSGYPVASRNLRIKLGVTMQQYIDDDGISPSTMPPLQGVTKQYKGTLDSLMSFEHGRVYGSGKTYTKGELRALTPKDVVCWMNLKSFGITDPPSDANPTLARSNILAYWKKASSFFMPNRLIVWVLGRNERNPSRKVNSLIKRVKKKEVRSKAWPQKPRVR